VLITGGSGFIGSHVVDKLVEYGYNVRVFDKVEPHIDNVEWFKGDLLDSHHLLEACVDVEVIYHLAAIADVNVALSHPELCLQVNEQGTLNLLRAATAREAERFVLASTTWVYGKRNEPVDEETSIQPPDHIYTKTKIGQEHLVNSWEAHFGLPYTILRYGIPYGPRMRSNMVISIFTRRAMKGQPITIYGDGKQGRCFIYVEDLAEGNIKALTTQGKNQVFNIAGNEFVTINQMVSNLKKVYRDMNISYGESRSGDFKGVHINIEKAKKELGWIPQVEFSDGLRRYIQHAESG